MAVDLKWVVELGDRVTKPARDMVTGVTSFQEAIKKADKAIDGLGSGKLAKVGDSIVGHLKGGFASAGAAALSFGASASAELAKLAVEAGKFALEEIVATEDLDLALKTIIGDAKEFAKAKKDVTDLGNFLGKDPKEVEKSLTALVTKGHDVAEAMKILQGSADLKVLGHDANALVDAFTAVDDKGHLSSKAVAALSHAGLDPTKFRAILGEAVGSSGELQTDIENALKAGTLDTATLQAAALQTITQMTGKALGGLAEEQSHTIGGLLNTLKTVPARVMDALDASGLAEPLRRALESIDTALNPETESGKKVVQGFQKIGDSVGRLIDMVTGDGADVGDWVVGLANVFDDVADVLVVVSDLASDFTDEFKTGLDAILGPMGKFGGDAVEMDDVIHALSKTFKFLGAVVGVTVGLVVQIASWIIEAVVAIGDGVSGFVDWWDHLWRHDIPDGVTEAADTVVELVDGLLESFDDMVDDFTDFGSDIVDGLIDGIKGAWSGFKDMWNKLIEGLPETVRTKLEIHSPSALMGRLAGFTTAGFTKRIEEDTPKVHSAFADLVTPPSAAAAPTLSTVRTTAAGNIFNFTGDFYLSGTNAREMGEDLVDQVKKIIESEHAGVALALGAAA